MKYAWSLNGEDWDADLYDSREDAIAAAREEEEVFGPVYTAEGRRPEVDFNGLDLVDWLLSNLEDFQIKESENWKAQDATKEQRAELARELASAFNAWAGRHGFAPDWWIAEEIHRHE